MLYWPSTRFRRKVGECKNPLIRSQHMFHLLRLKNRTPEKQRWQTSPLTSHFLTHTSPSFPYTKGKQIFFRDAAPKSMSPQHQSRLSL